MNKLSQHLLGFSEERKRQLYSDIADCGLYHEYNNGSKKLLKQYRKNSSGKVKKIFSALCKASNAELENAFRGFSQFKSNG